MEIPVKQPLKEKIKLLEHFSDKNIHQKYNIYQITKALIDENLFEADGIDGSLINKKRRLETHKQEKEDVINKISVCIGDYVDYYLSKIHEKQNMAFGRENISFGRGESLEYFLNNLEKESGITLNLIERVLGQIDA